MGDHVERELKLVPGEGFRLPEIGEHLPTRVFVSTYHDTPDLMLAQNGVTFRHRVEDGVGMWQLKIPHGIERVELESPGPPARPPEHLTRLLTAYVRHDGLVPVARLRTRREAIRADGAEIVEDSVAVLEAQRVTRRFRELEVELLDGDERTLRRLDKALRAAGATRGEVTPKLYRALELAGPAEEAPPRKGASPGEEIGYALHEQYRQIMRHDPGTRLGLDPEDLHQLRVATRRARAFLRAGRPLLDRGWAEELRAELGWLGSALGPVRDLDVLLEHLRAEVAALGDRDDAAAHGLLERLEGEREQARQALTAAMSDARYAALLDRLEHADRPHLAPGVKGTLAAIWWDELRRTRKAFSRLGPGSPDEQLHAARIRVKRARYAAELAAPELGKRGRRFVAAAKQLQDVLGEHQDACVAEHRIREWAESAPGADVAADRLVERQRARRREAREAWPAAWAELERRARKARR